MAIQDFFEIFNIMEKKRVSDGMGGFIVTYVDGVEFKAAISTDQSIEALVAEQQGVKSTNTITAYKNVLLSYDDIIKRKATNKYYRITSNPKDMETPSTISNLELYQVKAESYDLP